MGLIVPAIFIDHMPRLLLVIGSSKAPIPIDVSIYISFSIIFFFFPFGLAADFHMLSMSFALSSAAISS